MAGRFSSSLSRWWRGSLLYALLAGSFFFRWLVDPTEPANDYRNTSLTAQLTDKIMPPMLHWLYRIGDRITNWLKGSLFCQYWLSLLGVVVLLLSVVVLRLTLSLGAALSIALIGLGLILTRRIEALLSGTYLGRLTAWWLKD